jgi:hypothetical protein
VRSSTRLLVRLGLLISAYYAAPVLDPPQEPRFWLRAALATALLGVVVWLVVREILAGVRVQTRDVRVDRLVVAVLGGVLVFALTDLVIARSGEGQFVGLQTRTDALYFALATLTTVGYGDVHAVGQIARTLVVGQMTFNVLVLAAALRVVGDALQARRSQTP